MGHKKGTNRPTTFAIVEHHESGQRSLADHHGSKISSIHVSALSVVKVTAKYMAFGTQVESLLRVTEVWIWRI